MIQDIHPHRIDLGFRAREPRDGDYIIILQDNKALFVEDPGQNRIPEYADIKAVFPEFVDHLLYLFSIDDRAFYLFTYMLPIPAGFVFEDLQAFRRHQPSWLAFAGVTACHLALWYERNRYCGSCGSPMAQKEDERALVCGVCRAIKFPTISPAVIVGIVYGDRLLVTRYANRPGTRHALVAGFLEVGETLEDAVCREVMEEVGLKVKNLRYYKSQPWAFSGSVLVGFFADLDGSPEITLDTVELAEATWLHRDNMEPIDTSVSLTSTMMEAFRLNNHLI